MKRRFVSFAFALVVGNVFLPFIKAHADLGDRIEETKWTRLAEEIVTRYGSGERTLNKEQMRLYINAESVTSIDRDKNRSIDFDEYRNAYLHCKKNTEREWRYPTENEDIYKRYEGERDEQKRLSSESLFRRNDLWRGHIDHLVNKLWEGACGDDCQHTGLAPVPLAAYLASEAKKAAGWQRLPGSAADRIKRLEESSGSNSTFTMVDYENFLKEEAFKELDANGDNYLSIWEVSKKYRQENVLQEFAKAINKTSSDQKSQDIFSLDSDRYRTLPTGTVIGFSLEKMVGDEWLELGMDFSGERVSVTTVKARFEGLEKEEQEKKKLKNRKRSPAPVLQLIEDWCCWVSEYMMKRVKVYIYR